MRPHIDTSKLLKFTSELEAEHFFKSEAKAPILDSPIRNNSSTLNSSNLFLRGMLIVGGLLLIVYFLRTYDLKKRGEQIHI